MGEPAHQWAERTITSVLSARYYVFRREPIERFAPESWLPQLHPIATNAGSRWNRLAAVASGTARAVRDFSP